MQTINEYYSEDTKKLKSILKQENKKTMLFTLPIDSFFMLIFLISLFSFNPNTDLILNLLFTISMITVPLCIIYTIIMLIINYNKTKDTKKLLKISLQNDMKHFEEKLKTKQS